MPMSVMRILLCHTPAAEKWGSKALLSADQEGMVIHLQENNKPDTVQRAARKLDTQGIKHVQLAGEGWQLEYCWAFWLGFYAPKDERHIVWPDLSDNDKKTLKQRIDNVEWVRKTINTPAEELGPEQLAQHAANLLCEVGGNAVNYEITKGEALNQKGYSGLYTVGRGSERVPALLTVDYNPTGNPNAPVWAALVGKGITFDSGGYSLKQSNFMDSMKSDMGGAATIAGALALAIAQGLSHRIKLFLCCADNLVSGNAYKLGDIIRYRNGKTVEIMNTDAEGRLVLADGLIDAEAQQPELIIDCATLTGAAKTALGNDYHAIMSFDDQLAQEMLDSAADMQEGFWRLPLAEFHRNQLPSSFADLNNIAGSAHSAGASTAAAFLSHFLSQYQQGWLHIDCSATYRKGAVERWATGATGIGVRTIANFLLTKSKQSTRANQAN